MSWVSVWRFGHLYVKRDDVAFVPPLPDPEALPQDRMRAAGT